jgi:hypothetical protein
MFLELAFLLGKGILIHPATSGCLRTPHKYPLHLQAVFSHRYWQVRMIQTAEERLKKDTRTAKRSAAAAKLPMTKEQLKIKEQMEADRLERASRATPNAAS